MEFERALFRIHQRTLNSDPIRQVRIIWERWLPWVFLVLLASLVFLHTEYVGTARCLPIALAHAGLWNSTSQMPLVDDDTLLSITVVEQLGYGADLLDIRLQMPPPRPRGNGQGTLGSTAVGAAFSIGSENVTALSSSRGLFEAVPPSDDQDPGYRVLDQRPVVVAYRFAYDREVLFMRQSVFDKHHFKMHNITISDRCLSPARVVRDTLRLLDALDTVVINELAYTLKSRGYLERVEGTTKVESWAWSADQVNAVSASGWSGLFRKVLILAKAIVTFIIISSITGLFIRVAVNGSAVLMFPLAMFSQRFGSGRMPMGVLTRSFPWIGVYVEVLRRSNQSPGPLFRSHLIFLLLQSFSYLSCNLAWRFVLYRKSTPEGFEERCFSFCSALELFNLIFVRSQSSMLVFPKLTFACMVYLHFYVFAFLYPFHGLALGTAMVACVWVMVYSLNHFEVPALRGDPFSPLTPTAAHPRACYMPRLSPSWSLESAPLWTMFYTPEFPDAFPEEAMRHISNEEYAMP